MRNLGWIIAWVGLSGTALAGVIPEGMKNPVPIARYSIDVGGGSLAYRSGDAAGGSGAWGVVAGYTPQRYLTLEAAYTGAAGNATGGGVLLDTIIEGDARFNPIPGYRLSPYLVGGLGWGGFHETRSTGDNSTMTIPVGAGMEVRLTDRFALGARLTYRIVTFDRAGPAGAGLDNWATMLRFGAKL